MDLFEFKNNLDKIGGPRSYMLFEAFILKLLEEYFNKKSKPFYPRYRIIAKNGMGFEFDAYAPDGIDELIGPVMIEIKYFLPKFTSGIMGRVYEGYHILHKSDKIDHININSYGNLFLIIGDTLSAENRKRIEYLAESREINLKLWDLENLSSIMNDHSFDKINSLKELSESALNTAISESLRLTSEERIEKKKDNINRLAKAYKNEGIVLFLGSGISKDVGIPLWDKLISNLLIEMISEKLAEKSIVLDESERESILLTLMTENENSPLLQARYIRLGLGKNFIKMISKLLYENFKKPNDKWPKSLEILSQLCLPRRGNRGGVKAIITYNFDDVFEKVLTEKGIDCVSIYRESDVSSQDELGIYHVHGFLPNETEDNEQLSKSLLVFSEEGYHSLLLNPYSWQNMIQLNFLRESTCVMVGLSLNDPNLRRLLAISASNRESPKHFVILPRIIFHHNSSKVESGPHHSFTIVNEDLREKSHQELGLNTIWADNFDDIPKILACIKKK